MKKENLIDQKFNRLTVIDKNPEIDTRNKWLCKCDCGNKIFANAYKLKTNHTKSCGCLNIDSRKNKDKIEKLIANNRKYSFEESSARNMWDSRYKDGISFEDFYRLSKMNCFYCDKLPSNCFNSAKIDKKASQEAKDKSNFIYNGLDRVNNNLDHNINNIVPCCKWCNFAKRNSNINDFENWIINIYNNLNNF